MIGILSGALCGLFNGILVTKLQIPSIILTIGTLTLYSGIAQALASDFSLGGYPSWFIGIDYRYVGIIPIPVIIFTVFAIVVGFLLSCTKNTPVSPTSKDEVAPSVKLKALPTT